MASFESVNYSIRPGKSIQRGIVFDGLKRALQSLEITDAAYVGMGSIWFTDFAAAHRTLDVDVMASIEKNPVGYRRAKFNRTYNTIEIFNDSTTEALPKILSRPSFKSRPWIIWLDYDSAFDEDIAEDVSWAVGNVPENSILIVTFSAGQRAYGQKIKQRVDSLSHIFGAVAPNEIKKENCTHDNIPHTLAQLVTSKIRSEAAEILRSGGYIPGFRAIYDDTVPMVTIGGFLPSAENQKTVRNLVRSRSWQSLCKNIIRAPHLTLKEAATLQAELPINGILTREKVKSLGFDLEVEQIRTFQKYYKFIPRFAEIYI